MNETSDSLLRLGIEIIKTKDDSFIFKYGEKIAGPYLNVYQLIPEDLARELGVDVETAGFARFEALSMFEGQELDFEDLADLLGLTIRFDDVNKVVCFLAMLSAYTEDSQFNISFRAESSTGKSYIPLEIARLFPSEDVIEIAYSSPTSFWHDTGEWDPETQTIRINLHRKILIFIDMPHDQLLQRLRPLLSHDRKTLTYKITDRREKAGLRTKTVIIEGFPSVIFCTGHLRADEQEATRMIMLSPETSIEKIREGIFLRAARESNKKAFEELIELDPKRKMLRSRIGKIKQANILDVIIEDPERIADRFVNSRSRLKPRHMRDIGRLISLVKSFAILNFMHRDVVDRKKDLDGREWITIKASQRDIENAFKVWDLINEPQEYGVPPFVYQVFKQVIEPLAMKKSPTDAAQGPTRVEIMKKFLEVFGRPLSRTTFEREIVPSLEAAGLLELEPHPEDKRKNIYIPTTIKKFEADTTPQSRDAFLEGDIKVSEDLDIDEKYASQHCGVVLDEDDRLHYLKFTGRANKNG